MLFFQGILETTTGSYDISPWSGLNLDSIDTMMDYFTIIASNPDSLTYSVTYGYEQTPVSAICLYGKGFLWID
jgi:hypothetical protein